LGMKSQVLLLACALAMASCSSETTMPSSNNSASVDKVACSLSPAELAARRQQLIPGLFKRADKVEDILNGVRFHFTNEPGLVVDLARIMEQEQDCCSFLRFQLSMEPGGSPIMFEVTGPAGTTKMLRKL
jgi:hypothetical protein